MVKAIIQEALGRLDASVYVCRGSRSATVSVNETNFNLTFAMLDKLATGLQTKAINLSHDAGGKWSSWTYDPAKTEISISEIPLTLFDKGEG